MRGCYFCCVWCVIVNGDISAAARYRIRSLQLWHAECVPSLVFQASECLFDSWGSAKKCIPVGEAQEQMSLRMTFTANCQFCDAVADGVHAGRVFCTLQAVDDDDDDDRGECGALWEHALTTFCSGASHFTILKRLSPLARKYTLPSVFYVYTSAPVCSALFFSCSDPSFVC